MQLLLALINGTAVLVIAAAILALVAFREVEHFTANIASTMTSAVLARVGGDPHEMMAKMQSLTSEIRDFKGSIKSAATRADSQLNSDLARLNGKPDDVRAAIDRLVEAKGILSDEAISRIGRVVANALEEFRGCSTKST
jgi:hypothetical protein